MDLSNTRKAAILLKTLDPAVSMDVLKHLDEKSVEAITREMSDLGTLSEEEKEAVRREFYDAAGMEAPPAAAPEPVPETVTADIIKQVGQEQIATMLKEEHPLTVGIILSSLEPPTAALILSVLPPELQISVVGAMTGDTVAVSGVREEVLKIFGRKVNLAARSAGSSQATKTETTAEILSYVETEKSQKILDALKKQDEKTGDGIESLIFTFDNIFTKIEDDKSIQRALRNIDRKDLVLALRKANNDTKERIFRNMSQSASEMLREDIDVMGPQKLHLVEEAQRKIVNVIKLLAKEGVIGFASSKQEEEVV